MSTIKEEAVRLLERLPEHATWDDLIREIQARQSRAGDDQAQAAASPPPPGAPPGDTFSSRWRGKFVPAEHGDERYKALAVRYL